MILLPRARARLRATSVVAVTGALLAFGMVGADAGAQASTSAVRPATAPDYRAVCSAATAPGVAHCDALERTDIAPVSKSAAAAIPDFTPSGYSAQQLQSAYNLAVAANASGSGTTVAIVDALSDPNANSDLAIYRQQFGLPVCSAANGCLTILNQTGAASPLPPDAPSGAGDWSIEESLDLDMVSAICPLCHIDLFEANTVNISDLGTAVNSAVARGVKFISNSYGSGEFSTESSYDSSYYNHPGVVITASAGDTGYGVEYPAASPDVTSVGGTALSTASNSRGWTESVWSTTPTEGTGSGCSADESQPSWQTALHLPSGCPRRSVADVSAVASPQTPVAVYDTDNSDGGWLTIGGTSVASPIIAATYALAGTPAAGTYPSQYPYQHTANLYDVTSGSTASCSPAYLCTAEFGYDGPTGLGTPDGTAAFTSTGTPALPVSAFEANVALLGTASTVAAYATSQSMASGTSPSIAALAGGGYEIAYQNAGGSLVVFGSGGASVTGLGMKAGTSPAIAALPGGGYDVTFEANTNVLWNYSPTGGGVSLNQPSWPGASPSIAALSNGVYEIAFEGSDGGLYTVPSTGGAAGHGLAMYTPSTPSIAAGPSGSYDVAYQASTGYLWNFSSTTGTGVNLGLQMWPGGAPSIVALTTGVYEIAFQQVGGSLWTVPSTGSAGTVRNLGMSGGSAPSIAALSGGSYEVAFQTNTNVLWTMSAAGATVSTNQGMYSGTSPSLAP